MKGKDYQYYCRECNRKNVKKHYQDNKDRYLTKSKQYKKSVSNFVENKKVEKGCVVCGYNKCTQSLDFHHLNKNDKDFEVSRLVNRCNWDKLLKEIDKCVVVCRNCHGEIHSGLININAALE